MTTRRMAVELKLKNTLQELKASQDLCQQLLEERADSEAEVDSVNERVSSLKNELTELHCQFESMRDQRDHLQSVIDSQEECHNNYEAALTRIIELEKQVAEAYNLLKSQEEERCALETQHTMSLYDELMQGKNCQNDNLVTIDLTSMSEESTGCNVIKGSNKIKKYLRLQRLIRKTKKMLKLYKKNGITIKTVCEEKYRLKKRNCELRNEIDRIQSSLSLTQSLYENSQREIAEHIKTAESLVEMGRSNMERFESLINDQHLELEILRATTSSESCEDLQSSQSSVGSCLLELPPPPPTPAPRRSVTPRPAPRGRAARRCVPPPPPAPAPAASTPGQVPRDAGLSAKACITGSTVVFSDDIGVGLGLLLRHRTDNNVTNVCMPGASYAEIVTKLLHSKFDEDTTVILLVGNSSGLTRSDLSNYHRSLLKVVCRNLIICSFPYVNSVTNVENNHIYSLNQHLYNRTCHTSDILYLDLNKFVKNCFLTNDRICLSNYFKKMIATLLAFYINDPYAKPGINLIDCTNHCSILPIIDSSQQGTTVGTSSLN